MNRILITITCCVLAICAHAQDEPRIKLIGLETGGDVVLVEVADHDNIRAEASYYADGLKNIRGFASRFTVGLKAEMRTKSDRFSLTGGLRFSRLDSKLGKGNTYYSTNTSDHFYFMVEQTDNSIEYLRVKEINETSNYIGVPFAVNWTPFGERLFTFYFKAGVEVNFRLNTTTTVDFVDPALKAYNDDVTDHFREAGNVSALFNTGGGIRFRAGSKLRLSFEAGPSAFLTNDGSRIVNTLGAVGGQLSIQLAL